MSSLRNCYLQSVPTRPLSGWDMVSFVGMVRVNKLLGSNHTASNSNYMYVGIPMYNWSL